MALRELAYEACQNELDLRIKTTQKVMEDAEASAQNETKSSAGDKFETGRAMMQREKENNKVKLIKLMELKHQFMSVPKIAAGSTIGIGSFVNTSLGNFFIGIGLGKIKTPTFSFVAVSPLAPLVKNIIGKQKGDVIVFNERSISIIDVQ